jgi:hypothetical protein
MVSISRAANRSKHPEVQPLGLTVHEVCAAADISPSTYRRLKRKGLGPREMRFGTKIIRITPEAAAQWLQALERR